MKPETDQTPDVVSDSPAPSSGGSSSSNEASSNEASSNGEEEDDSYFFEMQKNLIAQGTTLQF